MSASAPSRSIVTRFARARPTRPGEVYGVPGQGETWVLNVVTIGILLGTCWLAIALG